MTTADPSATIACASGCDPEAQRMVSKSPKLALALHYGIDMLPYPFTVAYTYTTAAANGTASGFQFPATQGQTTSDLVVEAIDIDLQTKDFNTGALLKPEADLAYDYTSGITAQINIFGAQSKAWPTIPLKAVPLLAKRPWVLLGGNANQNVGINFSVTTALPSDNTAITVTFVCFKPAGDAYQAVPIGRAIGMLKDLGYCTTGAEQRFCSHAAAT